MLTFDEAKSIAFANKEKINKCTEHEDAFSFFYDDGTAQDGGENPIVVLKESGQILNFIQYAIKSGNNKILRTFDV